MKPEIEFLQEIKNEFATAEYGEGTSVNLHGIARTINDRINRIRELSKQTNVDIKTNPEMNKNLISMLKLRGGGPKSEDRDSISLYAIARIEELERQLSKSGETPFFDMHGNKVAAGDKIKIIHHYNCQHLHGIEAEVVWNKDKGLYEFRYVEVRRNQEFPSSENFYGVHEFELIKSYVCLNKK